MRPDWVASRTPLLSHLLELLTAHSLEDTLQSVDRLAHLGVLGHELRSDLRNNNADAVVDLLAERVDETLLEGTGRCRDKILLNEELVLHELRRICNSTLQATYSCRDRRHVILAATNDC